MAGGGLDRRGFLRAAAMGVGAVASAVGLADCGVPPSAPASRAPAVTPAAAPAWARLDAALDGRLVRRGDPAYGAERLLYDPRFDDLRPAAIALCASAKDVATSLQFARDHGIEVAPRCGGHSYAGYSSGTDRLVIDVTPMARVVPARQPGGEATVGAGARLIDVYNVLGGAGQLVPAGSCPTVGIAGLALGGGVGVFARRYGLTVDHVAALTVVTADATVRRCTPDDDADLYWACRGGGGGNFGIVTSFSLTTHPMPPIALFTYDFDWDAATDVLGAWQRWTAGVDPAIWSNCQLVSGDGTYVRVAGVACAPATTAAGWLDGLLGAIGTAPSSTFLGDEGYVNTTMVEAGCSGLAVAACHLDTQFKAGTLSREAFFANSSYLSAPMDDARLAATVAAIDRAAAELPWLGAAVAFDALGGAVNEPTPTTTAFVHRRFIAGIQSTCSWGAGATPAQVAAGARWLAAVRESVYLPADGAYQNYIDPTLVDWPQAYYGENLARLRSIKRDVDPDDVFHFAQSIPPAA